VTVPSKTATKDPSFDKIVDRIRTARNFDFRNYKRETLQRRIARRMGERKTSNYSDYLKILDREPEEYSALISTMLIKVTTFFRDPEAWTELAARVLPRFLDGRKAGSEIRIWSAGCATGEEAYSLAILVAEHLGPAFVNYDIKIFGTDVDEAAISYARRGTYTALQVEDLSKDRLRRWFQQVPGGYTVRQELRRAVVFGVNNLVSDAPISRLDLLVCRNVFIYLDATLQQRVLNRFYYALKPDGVLFLGKAELIPYAARLFEGMDLQRRLYCKIQRGQMSPQARDRLIELLDQERLSSETDRTLRETGLIEHFHRNIATSLPIPVIATTMDGTISLWNEPSARLWGRTEGEALGRKLAQLALPGLSGEILVEKTNLVRDGRSQRESGDGKVPRGGEAAAIELSIDVTPMRGARGDVIGILYTATDISSHRAVESQLRDVTNELQAAHEAAQTTNEELQSSNEELQTTNEELQSSNEELQTTNEELQSTNEELETTNEELQSTNAELDATNRELAARTEEMNLLGLYQRTIIRSLSAAVVVLDIEGRITAWNVAAERLLGLAEVEALGQLIWTLRVPALGRPLVERIRRNFGKNLALRVEDYRYPLHTGGRGHAVVAAVPLLEDGNYLGAVVVFEDITNAVGMAAQLRERDRTGNNRER
jgi:two-component system, chemotaxis family, CheB/CheR fusion protein